MICSRMRVARARCGFLKKSSVRHPITAMAWSPRPAWVSGGGEALASGNFTASAGNWTVDSGDQVYFAYSVIGKNMNLWMFVKQTSVSATPVQLFLAMPAGLTAAGQVLFPIVANDNGTALSTAFGFTTASSNQLAFQTAVVSPANWSTSTNNTYISFVATIPFI